MSTDTRPPHGVTNLKQALDPVFSGTPSPIMAAECYQFPGMPNLFLLPGNINVAELDVTISIAQELTGSLRLVQNVPGAINELIRLTSEKYGFDYVLIDMSPSVSATNANILMLSDFFMLPCSPDYFCNMAITSLTSVLPSWNSTYNVIKTNPVFKDAIYKFPSTTPKFIGTIQQRYRPRNGEPAKSFQSWIDIINDNVSENLVPVLQANNMVLPDSTFHDVEGMDGDYNIVNISDFNSLIAQSQKYNIPVFQLSDGQLEQSGNILDNMKASRDSFNRTFTALGQAVIELTA